MDNLQNLDQSESVDLHQEANPVLQYEQCAFCMRNFFKGKLKFHQKLCNQENPMIKSPEKGIKTSYIKNNKKNGSTFSSLEVICSKCQIKIPKFLLERHQQKCLGTIEQNIVTPKTNRKTLDQINKINKRKEKPFKEKQATIELPRIKNLKYVKPEEKKGSLEQKYSVKIREELSCFRKAQQVQKVECESCGRKFSYEASLRHIPICSNLKMQEIKSIALKKRKGLSTSVIDRLTERKSNQSKLGLKEVYPKREERHANLSPLVSRREEAVEKHEKQEKQENPEKQ